MADNTKAKGGLQNKETRRLPEEARPHQNLPIGGDLPVKRVYQKEPINETCWAWMKLLREKDSTKKIYPVDPYVEVYKFRDNLYGILTISLDGAGDSWIYLIDGPEKAMIIDTSFGLGDLKGLCEEITGGKPLIVVNTHNHYDHAYGNAQFDEVFCHEYEAPVIARQDEHIWDYLFEDGVGQGIWAEFPREALIPFKPYKVTGVPNGYTWDLGEGYEIELVFLGGHSAGHAGYLDKKNRIFFAGDDLISMRVGVGGPRPGTPHGECASINCMGVQMAKLAKRLEEFDHVFSGHFVSDLESTVVQYMAEACEAIIADPVGAASFVRETARGIQYSRYVEGLGLLSYSMNSIVDGDFENI